MNTDENSAEIVKEKPHIYFTKLKFNDDTELLLEKNSIIVFTGANNCGKSQYGQNLPTLLLMEKFMM